MLAADLPQGGGIRLRDVGSQDLDGPRCGRPQPVERTDQGRLTRTRQAHDDEDLALFDLEARVDDGSHTHFGEVVSVGTFLEPFDHFIRPFAEDFVDM